MSLLRVKGLKVRYILSDDRELSVLDIPQFELPHESEICVRGHSGSGKTTFLNVISGLRIPNEGKIFLNDVELTALSESERDAQRGKSIGFIFQTFNLLSGFTAVENVLLGSVFAGDPDEDSGVTRDRALDLLKKVGLEERADHYPRMLSAGEQQRVAIARALMNRPKLILADEPTGSLDEKNSKEVLELIRSLAKASDAALLLVTHDPDVMARFDKLIDFKDFNKTRVKETKS
jgi:ABC-type lipoprotein export system ATPase subunit